MALSCCDARSEVGKPSLLVAQVPDAYVVEARDNLAFLRATTEYSVCHSIIRRLYKLIGSLIEMETASSMQKNSPQTL